MTIAARRPMERSAIISEDGKYRYRLERGWGEGARVTFVMLNPSVADAEIDDRTVARCIGFARDWGFNGLVVVNVLAFIATKPTNLPYDIEEAWGADNTKYQRQAAAESGLVVAAWGAKRERYAACYAATMANFFSPMRTLMCLGTTKDGDPRHPLYLAQNTPLEPFLSG